MKTLMVTLGSVALAFGVQAAPILDVTPGSSPFPGETESNNTLGDANTLGFASTDPTNANNQVGADGSKPNGSGVSVDDWFSFFFFDGGGASDLVLRAEVSSNSMDSDFDLRDSTGALVGSVNFGRNQANQVRSNTFDLTTGQYFIQVDHTGGSGSYTVWVTGQNGGLVSDSEIVIPEPGSLLLLGLGGLCLATRSRPRR